jgi:hypothetical protein
MIANFLYYNKTLCNKDLDNEADTLTVCELAVVHNTVTFQIKQASMTIIITNRTTVMYK